MNFFEVQGNWNIVKGKLKQKFAQLTEDKWRFMEGKEDELLGRIQKRTGQARQAQPTQVSGERCASKRE